MSSTMANKGAFFDIEFKEGYVHKKPKKPNAIEKTVRIHKALEDIPEVIPVVEKDGVVIQKQAKGRELTKEDKESMKEFDIWLDDFTKRVREKGYRVNDMGRSKNVFYDKTKGFQVIDVNTFRNIDEEK